MKEKIWLAADLLCENQNNNFMFDLNVKKILLFTLMLAMLKPCKAQYEEVPAKEIGFRLIGLNNIDLVFKKEKKPNKIVRYRFGFSQVSLSSSATNTSFALTTSISVGVEKRKELMSTTYFFQGWEPGVAINYNASNKHGVGTFSPYLGYFIGFAHNFSDKFCMSLEIIPKISTTLNTGVAISKNTFKLDAGYGSGSIGIGFIYRIR
jgi:hypothetical protein